MMKDLDEDELALYIVDDGSCDHLLSARMANQIRRLERELAERRTAAQPVDTVGVYLTEQERRHVTNVLNDLEVREQAAIRSREGPEAATTAAEHAALKKLMYLPAVAAVAANKERVREVVRIAIADEVGGPIGEYGTARIDCESVDRIATRAAEQLATTAAGLSAPDRDVLLRMRKSIQHTGEFTALLDRLLATRVPR